MYRKAILLVSILLIQICLKAQDTNKASKADRLDSLFSYCYTNGLFNGNVLVARNDQIVFQKSYGLSNPIKKDSLTKNSAFLLASLSKQFTAMGIVFLHSKNLLTYDDRVTTYLPEFPYEAITIRHLLNHTSGLAEYTDFVKAKKQFFEEDFVENGNNLTNISLAKILRKIKPPLEFEPGSNFNYSNTGFVYLALIIEAVSNMSYADFLEHNLFRPAGLKHTGVITGAEVSTIDQAVSYEQGENATEFELVEKPDFYQVYGDGGIFSSGPDLLRWFVAQDKGKIVNKKFLIEAYQAPVIKEQTMPYGFGWFVRNHPMNQHKILTHSGQFLGFTNSVFRDLDIGLTLIILSNNSHDIKAELNRAATLILYDRLFDYPKLDVQEFLLEVIANQGIEAAKQEFKKIENQKRYDISEKAVNSLGYKLMKTQKLKEALEVFKWNVEKHPTSSNVYDSLGEAYLAREDILNAQIYYQKSLNLDSTNENARKILEKLK